jgi:hypothetical protein
MKHALMFVVLLFMFFSIAHAEEGYVSSLIKQAEQSRFELVKDWRVLSLLLSFISIILIAIAYMVGKGFEMPDLQAWAEVELTQVITTAIIVAFLIATITFLDNIVRIAVEESEVPDPFNPGPGKILSCNPTDFCAEKITEAYFKDLNDTMNKQAQQNFKDAVKYAKQASTRSGWSCNVMLDPLYCLWLSFSYGDNPHLILHTERLNIVLEYYAGVFSSIYAQQFFVENISFKIAPMLFLIGIVGRSFFITRKLGGLLMAIGIGVMFVFPLMYIFDWVTMNVMLFGDAVFDIPGGTNCPAECIKGPPIVFEVMRYGTTTNYYWNIEELENRLRDLGITQPEEIAKKLAKGNISDISKGPYDLSSCEWLANHTEYNAYCPRECRYIPYPSIQKCLDVKTQFACAALDPNCKVVALVNTTTHPQPENLDSLCPKECRTIPALKSNCSISGKNDVNCLYAPFECRVALKNNLNWRPEDCNSDDTLEITTINGPVKNFSKKDLSYACNGSSENANESCLYVVPDIQTLDSKCDGCVFVPVEYTFNPPIYPNCADACSKAGRPKVSPADVAKQSKKGMVGREDIKNVASILLPGYLLPLLNTLVTIMFIKTFSPIFGGDIEIPGLAKVL